LGLGVDDWILLVIGILLIVGIYFLATWLVKCLLLRLVSRTEDQLDDILLENAGKEIYWLVLVIALQIVMPRLVFLFAGLKSLLGDVYFVLAAAGLGLLMVGAIITHLRRKEYPNIFVKLILLTLIRFVANGYISLVPVQMPV